MKGAKKGDFSVFNGIYSSGCLAAFGLCFGVWCKTHFSQGHFTCSASVKPRISTEAPSFVFFGLLNSFFGCSPQTRTLALLSPRVLDLGRETNSVRSFSFISLTQVNLMVVA